MEHQESNNPANIKDENHAEESVIQQELADAQNEIAELKIQIQWLERSYE